MKSESSAKASDCVKWTRRPRERIRAEIKNMSPEEVGWWYEGWRPTDSFLAELLDRRKRSEGRRAPGHADGRRSIPLHR